MMHLVTGGAGFLGSLIVKELLLNGENVKVLDINYDKKLSKDVEFIKCDIRDKSNVEKYMKGIDVVHHNVALVPLTKSGRKFWDVNVEGSRIAAEAALKNNVESFIHMSSSALYGNVNQFPITEKTPLSPIEIYGKAKLEGEKAVMEVLRDQIPLTVVRPRTILGEGRLGIFQILFEWINNNKNVYVIGSGDVKFQFIHAKDLIDAYMLINKEKKSGVYNIGTNKFGTLREALENLIINVDSLSKVKSLPVGLSIFALQALDKLRLSPLAPWHYLTYHKEFHFDVSNIIELGWEPKYSNDDMLLESYEWFMQHHFDNNENIKSPHRSAVQENILKLIRFFS